VRKAVVMVNSLGIGERFDGLQLVAGDHFVIAKADIIQCVVYAV